MNPTQPKDAEMDEKRFPASIKIRCFPEEELRVSAFQTPLNMEVNKSYNYMSQEYHEAILSEERARLEEAVKALTRAGEAISNAYVWTSAYSHGFVNQEVEAINEVLAKLKSQPTEDKSGESKDKCPPHSWDDSGERCVKCGDKDWMT
jgi:hypothetical protein